MRTAGWLVVACLWLGAPPELAKATDEAGLARGLAPFWECLTGRRQTFALEATVRLHPADQPAATGTPLKVRIERFDAVSFDLLVEHPDHAATLHRRADTTALALPRHNVVHLGQGGTDPTDHLDPAGIVRRIVSDHSLAAPILPLVASADPDTLARLATSLLGARSVGDGAWQWRDYRLELPADGDQLGLSGPGFTATLALAPVAVPAADWPGLAHNDIPRAELERTLVRGLRRGVEILIPGPALTAPDPVPRTVEHGRLDWVDGQRVVTLFGTPEQIGAAHGELLRAEAWRCLDSVLHLVGIVETIRDGRWFRQRLEEALARLAPHVPPRHDREMEALAAAIGCDGHLMRVVNVFPELFHCSGFAVMGSATADGTLYHGRVLDYMTEIGLQDAATTFVVAAEGSIPFVNVGYAGFTGSVSGMNERGISLGEMGGRGEGHWDGVPMATLMRRALEECTTLEEVMDLWRRSPRTCEYYFVFADGKTRRAVGVAATPDAIEFVQPGAAHPRLGPGIPDAVVLSAGERLECLRGRITEGHGRIDEKSALGLMARPVAMRSNLHNVLFVPERLRLHVANASHSRPAAEMPAVELDLAALLSRVPGAAGRAAGGLEPGATFAARDSLAPAADDRADARDCLAALVWEPTEFPVRLEPARPDRGDLTVRFASPRPGGVPVNDEVAIEWHMAEGTADGQFNKPSLAFFQSFLEGRETRKTEDAPAPSFAAPGGGRPDPASAGVAPACVVVHESGSGMSVGRMIARGLAARGVHAFLVHLPYYGLRRPPGPSPGPASLVRAVSQAVADVRRARDAVAVLPGVDPTRVGVQGTSLGGFVAATAAGIDRGFSPVFVMLAGGDIAGVLSAGRREAETLRRRLAEAGMTEAEVRAAFHAVEPLRIAHRLDPARTWLYSALYDEVVPPRNAALFSTAAGLSAGHHVELHATHYSGIVYLPLVLAAMSSRLKADEGDLPPAAAAPAADPEKILRDAINALFAGQAEDSAKLFDAFVAARPASEPQLWQRGIALYYAGRFAAGRRQFEVHRTVNPADVENAAWHFACVAREAGPQAARDALLPVGNDPRVPMREILALFAGDGDAAALLAAADAGPESGRRNQRCYAHLYLGLHAEACGDAAEARRHISLAAGEFSMDHFMGRVARLHARLRGWEPAAAPPPKP